jgi:hypothetical protein
VRLRAYDSGVIDRRRLIPPLLLVRRCSSIAA